MEATGCATAAAICTCAPVQNRCGVPQVLPAYGLQDSRNHHPNPKTKSNTNTMCLQNTLGEDPGSGHFYLAETGHFYFALTRTVAATVVSIVGPREEGARCKAGASPSLRLLQLTTNEGGTSKRIK
jgi:hypothetical protein